MSSRMPREGRHGTFGTLLYRIPQGKKEAEERLGGIATNSTDIILYHERQKGFGRIPEEYKDLYSRVAPSIRKKD